MADRHQGKTPQAEPMKQAARTAIMRLKRENAPRMSDTAWMSSTGYNYGSWANKGFNIALNLLDKTPRLSEEDEAEHLRRIIKLIRKQRDVYHADDEDEYGACSGALDAAAWAIAGVLPAQSGADKVSARWVDPVPTAVWEVWYRDLFDREMPPQMEASGRGLRDGLIQLWARFLFETTRPGGEQGFSRFNLVWDREPVVIEGDAAGAVRLRQWVFGDQEHIASTYVDAGDVDLLTIIASCHGQLLLQRRRGDLLLDSAAASQTRASFEESLAALMGEH